MLRSGLVLLVLVACASLSARSAPMNNISDSVSNIDSAIANSITNSVASSIELDVEGPPMTDQRAGVPLRNLDTLRTFPTLTGKADWEARRERLRQQALVACGLWPLPPKTPLHPHIFGRVERDGYTIEKVAIQTHPGFYLAGNLYRPHPAHPAKGKAAAGRHPGILVTHGHWEDGRMADTEAGSIAARAITFARQGCVAFTYDMVGYNDTRQIPTHRTYAADNAHWLWGISLMGLQTWNSVRALDFLESLPDVDKSRLAITGESGGGTQTMLLAAVDDRLAAVAPCVMVSHSMQGGCLCENAPGLRVDASNMEVAATFAPKPQIMVGATGDWTRTMMTIEGPGVKSAYDLYAQPDPLKYVIFPFNHNINKTSRDAVYQFFGRVLLHDPNADSFTEPAYKREPVADLRVFPDDTPLPGDAKTAEQLTQYLKELGQSQLQKAAPHDAHSLTQFQQSFRPLWERTLNLDVPGSPTSNFTLVQSGGTSESDGSTRTTTTRIGRKGHGDSIPVQTLTPEKATSNGLAVVIVHPKGGSALLQQVVPLVWKLTEKGTTVVVPDLFLTGVAANPAASAARKTAFNTFGIFFTTYNRTDAQERVQDIVTACAYARQLPGVKRVAVVGLEQFGALTMLAAPAADMTVADVAKLDLSTDDALLTDSLYVPCLRKMGDFRTALMLAAPHPLLLHNTGEHFGTVPAVQSAYAAAGKPANLHASVAPLSDDEVVRWLTRQSL